MTTQQQKPKLKVPFTKAQYIKVQQFLDWIRGTKMVEKDLGTPVTVVVAWSSEEQDTSFVPHVHFVGPLGEKKMPLKDIIEADDSKLIGPATELKQ